MEPGERGKGFLLRSPKASRAFSDRGTSREVPFFVSLSRATLPLMSSSLKFAISEALIATAIGLLAAIPAAVFFNHFVGLLKKQSVDMDCFIQDFLNIVQRGLLTGTKGEASKTIGTGP